MPKRIQLSRKKGWRLPPGAMSVARPTKWGNPFPVRGPVTAAKAVEMYRKWVEANCDPSYFAPLRGKDLACWCALVDENGKPVPCHADELLRLANG